jgi:hypothetical protein
MTQPNEYVPEGGLTDEGIAAYASKTQFDWYEIQRNALLDRFLPSQFGFLSLFSSVEQAQKSANFANTNNLVSKASSLASAVGGGVSVSDTFTGSAGALSGWTRTSTGAGAGTYALNGSGLVVWTASGNTTRTHIDRYDTPLATDTQAAMTIVSESPQYLDGKSGYTYLLLRCNSARDTFVWARISESGVAVGNTVSGTFNSPWATETNKCLAGDQFVFLAGTNASQREFLVIKNGYVQIRHTDTTSSAFGSGYRYVGMAATATGPVKTGTRRNQFWTQSKPASLDVWAAADRQSSTT